jgi:hypothetical protein
VANRSIKPLSTAGLRTSAARYSSRSPLVLTLCLHICINIDRHECPHNFCLCNGVIHVPACICTALRSALAYFSSIGASGLRHRECGSGERLWRIGRSLRSSHGERRPFELRGNDGGASHVAVRRSCSGLSQRMRHRTDYRSRPLCTRQTYRFVAGRSTSDWNEPDRARYAQCC